MKALLDRAHGDAHAAAECLLSVTSEEGEDSNESQARRLAGAVLLAEAIRDLSVIRKAHQSKG